LDSVIKGLLAGPSELNRRWVVLLLLLFFFLLPFGESSHLPITLLLFMSLIDLGRQGLPRDVDVKPLLFITAALIVPLLFSLYGAFDVVRTLRTALIFLLYAIAGIYVIRDFCAYLDEKLLLYGISGIILFWTADALLQFFHGANLFGWPTNYGGRLTGMWERDVWIGYTFAHLAPFFFETLRRWSHGTLGKSVWLLTVPFVAVIMLSGGRASWVTLGLILPVFLIWLVRRGDFKFGQALLVGVLVIMAISASIALSPDLQRRVGETLLASSGHWEDVNNAGSSRLEVWRGAWLLYLESPINGIGAHAYDPVVFDRGYTSIRFGHAHLYALDVMLSTGLIGVIAFMSIFAYVCLKLVQALSTSSLALPAWLAAASIMFPLNAHWSFYASRPASLFWMLLIVALAIAAREALLENQGGGKC